MNDNGSDPDHNDSAGQARKGLLDMMTGKAKEFVGALTGNDELTEEGQLRQASAAARRDAGTSDALAETHVEQATSELHSETQHAEEQRRAAAADADERARSAAQAAQHDKASIDADAARREQAAQDEIRKQAAADLADHAEQAQDTRVLAEAHEADGQQDHDQLLGEAEEELDQAAQLRRHADAVSPATDMEGSR